jgi:predicted metal-dependent phosphoesterase TrpH
MFLQPSSSTRPIRVDLHCHSSASSEAGEAMLGAINCPESFSEPSEVYAQARRRGMDFVTVTDHDCTSGVQRLLPDPRVLVGEELTCFFPEDRCKMHVLVWGITQKDLRITDFSWRLCALAAYSLVGTSCTCISRAWSL